jgi:hypothetical protein
VKEEKLMAMYKHSKTETIAELVEKQKLTVKMKVIETGEIKEIGSATFKRWWKQIPDETTPENVSPEQNSPIAPEQIAPENTNTEVAEHKVLELSEIVKKLEDCFDLLNSSYFENALPRPVITVQSTPQAYGHCSIKKVWRKGDDENGGQYEINIGAEFLNRPSENTAAIMCHEMVHLYCRENDLNETCQNGRYHNKLFKQEAEARDLEIGYNRTIGHSATTPTPAFIETLKSAGFVLEVSFARHTIEPKKARASRAKAHTYLCPLCGQKVRSTNELNLICGDCEVPLERAE